MIKELKDGESVEVKGSAKKPYLIKRVGDVISCSCPAWRNQSLPINLRTCKHIRKVLGDESEKARLGRDLATKPKPKSKAVPPEILLAETWTPDIDPAGWWMSEKLDGVRGYWTGKKMLSRLGNVFYLPDWFKEQLPSFPLDGELWIGRKMFQETVSIVRTQGGSDELWGDVNYVIFDAPRVAGGFEQRMQYLRSPDSPYYRRIHCANTYVLEQELCKGHEHLLEILNSALSIGAEGLMLREPGSLYEGCRSSTLLKVKKFLDDEATVTGYEDGKGRHKGRVGSLVLSWNDKEFRAGTGLKDSERKNPPVIGSKVTFKYQELSTDGIPRFPVYVGPAVDK